MSRSPLLTPLPPPLPNQSYVSVSPFVAGTITLPDSAFISPADPTARRTVPSLSFLITHPSPRSPLSPVRDIPHGSTPFRLLFDLGLRSDLSAYLPAQQSHLTSRKPYTLMPGAAAQIQAAGIAPRRINAVLLSHVHYDHHGDPASFPGARFLVGRGSLELISNGLGGGSHQVFDPELFARICVMEVPYEGWEPLGPFPRALDLCGDRSLYVLDLKGHLPGHVGLLCRVGEGEWVCLAGDAFHDRRLLTGEREIGFWQDGRGGNGGRRCIHHDPEGARETIERLRVLEDMGVEIIAAHDERWVEENPGRMLPNVL